MADREILIRRSVTITVRMPVDSEHEERALEMERNLDENWEEFTEWFIDVLRDGPNEITAIDIGNTVRSQAAEKTVVVETTITMVSHVPLNADFYGAIVDGVPDDTAEENAIRYELNLDHQTTIQSFVEHLEFMGDQAKISKIVYVKSDDKEDLKKYWTEGGGSEPLVVN